MKQKELLLWVVAIAALALSLITIIGPKGLKSDAAMRTAQISSVQNASPVTLGGDSGGTVGHCESLARALKEAENNIAFYSTSSGDNTYYLNLWWEIKNEIKDEMMNSGCATNGATQ